MIKVWVIMLVGFNVPVNTAVQYHGETITFDSREECLANKEAFDHLMTEENKKFAEGYLAHTCVAMNVKTI